MPKEAIESLRDRMKQLAQDNQKRKPARKRVASAFAKNLAAILEERGVSQRSVAEIANVNVATIHDWLQGAQPNDMNPVLKICKALKCDFQWLLTDSKANPSTKEISLSEFFDIEDDPAFSGMFLIQAKRLKRKGNKE